MAPQAIINQYIQYCLEQDFVPLGNSTIFKILQNCTATIRKSLEGLDYYLAEGWRSFDDLIAIVDSLETNEAQTKQITNLLLGAKRYLKTDSKVHVADSSEIADHCRRHALSDDSVEFSSDCGHNHTKLCESCEQVKEVVKDVKLLVQKTDFSQREDQDDIAFRLRQAEASRNQEEAKNNIFLSLSNTSTCIVLDWAMKFLRGYPGLV